MATKELNLGRSDFFLHTKYTPFGGQDQQRMPYNRNNSLPDQVKTSLAVLLSLVLHSPLPTMEDTMTVWRTMESFVDDGIVKQLGISNCSDFDIFRTLNDQAHINLKVLQNQLYSKLDFDTALWAYCKESGVAYQTFWTLTANRHALALRRLNNGHSGYN